MLPHFPLLTTLLTNGQFWEPTTGSGRYCRHGQRRLLFHTSSVSSFSRCAVRLLTSDKGPVSEYAPRRRGYMAPSPTFRCFRMRINNSKSETDRVSSNRLGTKSRTYASTRCLLSITVVLNMSSWISSKRKAYAQPPSSLPLSDLELDTSLVGTTYHLRHLRPLQVEFVRRRHDLLLPLLEHLQLDCSHLL